ncbi:SH3 domain-containing protein [Thiohalomonas denitrificans]|uniref:Sel1 repeat-containing protein n=1 Tax=Thiohalomonas denitrificans TaxID=415747 RepID=A0A1G5PV56_9GAMM|nr:SH3 domain-containing protein [Thiohalomonas denitrificans]SCZ53454.1 Sel1 repeat-containing protein [Thiohalomonas denitrificans]
MSRRLRLVGALGLCLTTGMAQGAQPAGIPEDIHSRASEAMQQGNYAMAYCQWQPLAEEGDAEAQFALGWMYHHGYGLAIDDREAVTWWQRAVEQGHLEAMFSLGTLYTIGSDSVERDFPAAMRLWSGAARQGHQDARLALRQLAGRANPEVEEAAKELLAEQPQVFGLLTEVVVRRANIRGGPGTDHRVIAVMDRGKRLVEFLRRGDWVKIGVGGESPQVGWIYGKLVSEPEPIAEK